MASKGLHVQTLFASPTTSVVTLPPHLIHYKHNDLSIPEHTTVFPTYQLLNMWLPILNAVPDGLLYSSILKSYLLRQTFPWLLYLIRHPWLFSVTAPSLLPS